MTYIDYLNRFNRWLETNALPASSQLMFYKLLHVFNRAGWPERVGVDNLRLMLLTDTRSEKSAVRARDKLVAAGFITYRRGRKGTPNQYALCGGPGGTGRASAGESVGVSVGETDRPIKTKTKNETGLSSVGENLGKTPAGPGAAQAFFLERISPGAARTTLESLADFERDLGPEVCLRAMTEALEAGKANWRYIQGILRNKRRDGVRSIAAWDAAEAARRAGKEERHGEERERLDPARGVGNWL